MQPTKLLLTLAGALVSAWACTPTPVVDESSTTDSCDPVLCGLGDLVDTTTAEDMIANGECVLVTADDSLVAIDDGTPACIRSGEGECAHYCVTTCVQSHQCVHDGGPQNGGALLCSPDPCEVAS